VDQLLALLGNAVQFAYSCWDRIVLNGYLERLQRPENLVYFFHEVVGVKCIEPAVLEQRTNAYKAWVRRFTDEHGIPVLQAPPAPPKGVRKEHFVQPFYRRLKGGEGIACVLTSLEQGRTFVSYTPRWTPASGDGNYRLLKACRKRFLHYYFYVLDPVMGPMSVRVASYFPFNVTCYFNGHSFVAQELSRAGVRFRKADNAFLGVADVDALQAAADRLSPALLQQRCAYWVRRLVPTFSATERAALQPGYRYSMAQMELATDIVFKRAAPLKALFQRACELGVLVGGAERTTQLFGRRIDRRYQGKLQTVLDRRDAGHPVLRWYYATSFAKNYVRGDDHHPDRILRAETCSNDTRHFGVGRRLDNLPLLRDKLAATNDRTLALQADLLASPVDSGQLAALTKPTIVGQRRVPGLRLHDDRVIRLLDTLLHPAAFAGEWTTRELHTRVLARHRLADTDYRLSQLRYDLAKLRAKGLVHRVGRTRRYRLTPQGAKLGVLLVKLRTRLLGPLATLALQSTPQRLPREHSSVDAAFHQVDSALDHLCSALGLQRVA
jgi:DNA-binding transcriptional ArsR family regulator